MKPSPLQSQPPSHLSLVVATTACDPVPPMSSDRTRFWRAFVDWLAVASTDDTEQLERALSVHAHHVRPLVDAITDALQHRDSAKGLPVSLLATLAAHGWQPRRRSVVANAA